MNKLNFTRKFASHHILRLLLPWSECPIIRHYWSLRNPFSLQLDEYIIVISLSDIVIIISRTKGCCGRVLKCAKAVLNQGKLLCVPYPFPRIFIRPVVEGVRAWELVQGQFSINLSWQRLLHHNSFRVQVERSQPCMPWLREKRARQFHVCGHSAYTMSQNNRWHVLPWNWLFPSGDPFPMYTFCVSLNLLKTSERMERQE